MISVKTAQVAFLTGMSRKATKLYASGDRFLGTAAAVLMTKRDNPAKVLPTGEGYWVADARMAID